MESPLFMNASGHRRYFTPSGALGYNSRMFAPEIKAVFLIRIRPDQLHNPEIKSRGFLLLIPTLQGEFNNANKFRH